jgi:hypothetical protein
VNHRSTGVAIGLLKAASLKQTGEAATRAVKGLVRGSAALGGGMAKGLDLPEVAGQVAGVGALAGGAVLGGKRIKRKADEWKFRLMYGDPSMYY